jgi:hypothetical protein
MRNSSCEIFSKSDVSDQVKEELGHLARDGRGKEECMQNFGEETRKKEKKHFEIRRLRERIILKWTLNRVGCG